MGEGVGVHLTSQRRTGEFGAARSPAARQWAAVAIVASLAFIFWLDRWTDVAPFQHLYYAPIILAAVVFGRRGGFLTALAAVALYHLADPGRRSLIYREADAVETALFVAVGLVTARFVSDGRRLRHLAMTDDLTGLHNLRSFEARLDAIIGDASSSGGPVSMLLVDVDHLKAINDEHGHLAGAEAVREVGRLMAATMPPGAVACRYGGDEFAIALPRMGAAEAVQAAEGLRQAVQAAAPLLAGRSFEAGTLSVSVGVASRAFAASAGGAPPGWSREAAGEALFRAADVALYAAKDAGRNCVVAERREP